MIIINRFLFSPELSDLASTHPARSLSPSSNWLAITFRAWLFTLAAITIGGCANLSKTDSKKPTQAAQTQSSTDKPTLIERPFPTDTLYSLMAAELAGKRQQYTLALRNYLHQAKKTKDPKVIKRAMQIARYLKSNQGMLEAALLYHEIEPENIKVTQLAALQLAKANQFQRSFELSQQLITKGAATQLDFLAAQIISHKEPPTDQYLEQYKELLIIHPDRKDLLLGTSVFYLATRQLQQAKQLTEKVLANHPNEFQPNLLKSRILIAEKRFTEALTHIHGAVENSPKDHRLRMQYIRLLLNERQINNQQPADKKQAEQSDKILRDQFNQILLQNPRNPAMVINLANIAAQAGLNDIAELYLKQQIAVGYNAAQAHFQLGRFAESAGRLDEALSHYGKVDRGPLLAATGQQANILFQQQKLAEARELLKHARTEHPDQAMQIYQIEIELLAKHNHLKTAMNVAHQALQQFKNSVELLYSRSMLHERSGNIKQAEVDLRKILLDHPDDSMALNALGYSLAVHTKRYDEALTLIRRALSIKPEEAAIIDSLGWLQYQMGSLENSQKNLEKAYQQIKDPEVVSHLVEVLWVRGEEQRASQILFEALEKNPDSSELLKLIQKFNIPKPKTEAAERPAKL